jgi:hypothetical protein
MAALSIATNSDAGTAFWVISIANEAPETDKQ